MVPGQAPGRLDAREKPGLRTRRGEGFAVALLLMAVAAGTRARAWPFREAARILSGPLWRFRHRGGGGRSAGPSSVRGSADSCVPWPQTETARGRLAHSGAAAVFAAVPSAGPAVRVRCPVPSGRGAGVPTRIRGAPGRPPARRRPRVARRRRRITRRIRRPRICRGNWAPGSWSPPPRQWSCSRSRCGMPAVAAASRRRHRPARTSGAAADGACADTASALGGPGDPRQAIIASYAAMEARLAGAGAAPRVADTS